MNLLITGVSGYVGQAVVRRLIRHNPFKRVFGVDLLRPKLLGPVRYVPLDVQAEELGELLVMDDIQVVLHLAYASGRFGSARAEAAVGSRLLEAARLGELERVVFASPDRVYRAGERVNREDQPLCGMRGLPPSLSQSVRLDLAQPGPRTVVLRVGNIIGPDPGGVLDPFLSLPRILSPKSRDPDVQLLHIDDAAELFMAAALHPDAGGSYDVAGVEPIPLSVVAGILQKRLLRLPDRALSFAIRAMTRARVLPKGERTVRALHHGVHLDTERVSELGWAPRYTTRQTLAIWRSGHERRAQSAFRPLQARARR